MRRRSMLLSGVGAAGAMLVGWGMLPPRLRLGDADDMPAVPEAIGLNGWIKVTAQGEVLLAMPYCEMGQGIHTTLSMLVAEELAVPLSQVRCVAAGIDAIYANQGVLLAPLPWQAPASGPSAGTAASDAHRLRHWLLHKGAREWGLQLTTGSSSVMDAWDDLRLAAATARAQLLRAASLRWHQPVDELMAGQGIVSHPPSKNSAHYGELASVAAITRPGEVRLKKPSEWTVIGQHTRMRPPPPRPTPRFGMDLRPPGLLFAVVRHAPALGGGLGAVNLDAVLRLPGVERVVRLGPWAGATPAVAVVARSTWHALRAARQLQATWQAPPTGLVDTAQILPALQAQALVRAEADGVGFGPWASAASPQPPRHHAALYTLPYLAHAPLEPTNAIAQVHDGQVTVWATTQSPSTARALAARVARVEEDAVTLHLLPAGGSFGRRMDTEVIGQAVQVALETAGRPVQLLWSREEDMTHDVYRPAQAVALQASLHDDGRPASWHLYSAADEVTPRWIARQLPHLATRFDIPDGHLGEGRPTLPYTLPTPQVRHIATRSGVPVGHGRAGQHTGFAFASESFIDELAHLGGHDPLSYRLRLLATQPACAAVLNLAAEKAAWGRRQTPGVAQGLALHVRAHSIVALVAEVRSQGGQLQVLRVVCAADVGIAVHPDGVVKQLEGGVLHGLNAALSGRVDIESSQVRVRDFMPGRCLTLAQTPRIETYLVRSQRPPGGAGSIAVPVIAPAVANAWFRLTGTRLRSLPLMDPPALKP